MVTESAPVVAIMQPYFFPYIGYFQLIAAADIFVLLDDVQYIERGWSNRNRILINGEPHLLTFPVKNAERDLPYSMRHYTGETTPLLKTIWIAYAKAPHFGSAMPIIEEVMAFTDMNVAAFNRNLIETICRHIGLQTRILSSSEIAKDEHLTGQDRIIAICCSLRAGRYINPPGGTHLYKAEAFRWHEMGLEFLTPAVEPYRQFGKGWVPGLSIIDVMMFNPPERVREMVLRQITPA